MNSDNNRINGSLNTSNASHAVDGDNTSGVTAPAKPKREPWRIVVFILAVLFIVWSWSKKNIAAIYTSMPREQMIPLIATTVAVSLVKVGVIAGAVFLVKWLIGKIIQKC